MTICEVKAGVPQGSVLGPILYTIYTADMSITEKVTVATYADDTAIIASSTCPNNTSLMIQNELNKIEDWLKKWRIEVNTEKSVQISFTLRKNDCPQVYLNGTAIPLKNNVKYLGLHIDKRLTWKDHIRAKRQQLNIKFKKMYWLLGRKSQLSLENKILLYKTILKPIWTYGIQIWGTASHSNLEIIQRFQSKTLRQILDAPWYVKNDTIHRDLNLPKVKEEINRFSMKYLSRLSDHVNPVAIALLDDSNEINRLKRFQILDLPYR